MLVNFMDQTRDVGLDLGFEGGGQHPAGPFGHDGVQPSRQLRARGLVNMYSQHRRSFLPACHRQRSCLCQTGRYAASPFRWCIHRFRLYLLVRKVGASCAPKTNESNPGRKVDKAAQSIEEDSS